MIGSAHEKRCARTTVKLRVGSAGVRSAERPLGGRVRLPAPAVVVPVCTVYSCRMLVGHFQRATVPSPVQCTFSRNEESHNAGGAD